MHWRNRLQGLHPQLLDRVLEATVERSYRAGQVVFREGAPSDGMYLIETGRVLVEAVTIGGAAVGLNVVETGGVVGEQAMIKNTRRFATVTTTRPTEMRLMRPTQFRELRTNYPEIDRFLVDLLDDRLRELSFRLSEAVHSSTEHRVYRRLLSLSSAFDGAIRLSQASLATMAGTTRPTVNRVLQDLVQEEIVRLRRSRIEVIDIDALEARVPPL